MRGQAPLPDLFNPSVDSKYNKSGRGLLMISNWIKTEERMIIYDSYLDETGQEEGLAPALCFKPTVRF
jgi:hypothetical protein